MICPAPQRLVRRAVDRVAQHQVMNTLGPVQQPPAAIQIARHGGQRLVQLMREGGRHFPHRGETRHVDQLRLQILQPLLGRLTLGQVAHKPGVGPPSGRVYLANRQLHRKRRAVLARSHHHPAPPDHALLAGGGIARQVGVMLLLIGRGHQNTDVLTHHLVRGVAEQPLRRGAERLNDSTIVDDDHRVRNGAQHGPQMRLPRLQFGLRPFHRGDITRHFGRADQSPGIIPYRGDRQRHVDDRTILAPPPCRKMLDPLSGVDPLHHPSHLVALAVARQQDRQRLSDRFRGGIAEDGLRPGVPIGHDPIERLADDRVVRGRNDRRQPAGRRFNHRARTRIDQDPSQVRPSVRALAGLAANPQSLAGGGATGGKIKRTRSTEAILECPIRGRPVLGMDRGKKPGKVRLTGGSAQQFARPRRQTQCTGHRVPSPQTDIGGLQRQTETLFAAGQYVPRLSGFNGHDRFIYGFLHARISASADFGHLSCPIVLPLTCINATKRQPRQKHPSG